MSDIQLISPDGSESFTLYTESKDSTITADLITDNLDSALDIVGVDFSLNRRTRELTLIVGDNIDDDDYPNSFAYKDNREGYIRELERVINDWAKIDGLATLEWSRGNYTDEFGGFVTTLSHSINANTEEYTANIEFSEVDSSFT